MANKPIFFDASGRRAGRVSLIGWIVVVVGTVVAASALATLVSISAPKDLPFGRMTAIHLPELEKKAEAPGLLKSAEKLALEARARREELSQLRKRRAERGLRELPAQLLPQPGRSLALGFYNPTWSPDPLSALKSTLVHLDWVLPVWLPLQGPDLKLNTKFDPHLSDIADYIRRNKPGAAIVPVLQNVTVGKWDGPGLAKLLSDEKRRTALVGQIATFIIKQRFQGVAVDFEQVPDSAYGDLGTFLKQLTASLGPHGLIVAVCAPFDDDNWPFAAYARVSDYTILMAYDQHDDTSDAGSITGQSWYEDTLDKRMRVLNPARTIIAIGNYGYDWNSGHADALTFSDAVIAAHDSEAQIDFDDATNNPHFSYVEDDGTTHDIWFLDGVTAYNEIHAADPYQPAGYALWKIGSEDPSIWSVMGRAYGALPPKAINDMNIGDEIDYEGQGEILRVEAEPSPGTRTIETDPVTGDINDETYTKLPTSYVIRNFGVAPNKIALTFDDGPDPEWTPQILDILKEKHVKATFFVIGANAEANPGLVLRMYNEGHEVGDHTYTHPNLSDTPNEMVRIELTATQRLFEALTGHSMRFFRPPYLGDAEPQDADEIVPVEIAQDLGYTTVGEHIDPADWELPGVNAIVQRTLNQIHNPIVDYRGAVSIVLLHDAGGDRAQTVAALPILIDKLKAQGYQFVLVSDLVGLSRNQAMPAISPSVALVNDRVVFLSMSVIGHTLYYAFLVAIWLGIGRLFFLAIMSLLNRPREIDQAAPAPDHQPFRVSVLVPAFNEEKVIGKTIAGLLASDYRDLEILVIDDGSADNTSGVVREQFGNEPRVALIRVPNGGKASALNTGLARAQGDVVVALDADTQFNADTIPRLVRWFSDPEIGAVAGNAKVGNRTNMITRWQALEYVVAQNLERRALAGLGTLTVVPGAVGAWRREALVKLGGFRTDTLAEDQDLTIDIQRQGYRVHFDSSAIAWTEAPATFRGLAKQRFRWAYGTLQCLWKYRSLTFNPRYGALGMIALPQVWVFQILLTALAPLADLLLIWQLFWQWVAYLQHGAEFNNTDLVTVGIYYLVFVVVDVIAAIFGFIMEKGEDWSLLWWLPLQRFGYRQLMYYVVVRSISTAIRGPSVGWGKLERTGTVQVRRA